MSDAYPPGPPPPSSPPARVRPATVSIANLLLLLVAAVYLIGFVTALSVIGTMTDVFAEEFAGTEAEGAESFVAIVVVGASMINLLFAAGFIVLATLNNRAKNPARIVTWVVGGIALCCNGIGLAFSGLGTASGDIDQAQLEERLSAALPSWYEPLSLATTVIGVLALLAALILLALPPSNEFFRKSEPTFEPPPDYPPVG